MIVAAAATVLQLMKRMRSPIARRFYPVVDYLAHCRDMCKELEVPEKIDVSLVYAVRASESSLHCAVCLWQCGL